MFYFFVKFFYFCNSIMLIIKKRQMNKRPVKHFTRIRVFNLIMIFVNEIGMDDYESNCYVYIETQKKFRGITGYSCKRIFM